MCGIVIVLLVESSGKELLQEVMRAVQESAHSTINEEIFDMDDDELEAFDDAEVDTCHLIILVIVAIS
jgi:hypothetical protein